MPAATYGRFSTDRQRETSIHDQARTCGARAAALGLSVDFRYSDEGVSGSTPVMLRDGGRSLMADAMAGRRSVLLVEGLDRLSRDMVEQETIIRRLEHRGVRIIGVSDGYDSDSKTRKLHRGMRGIINEVYLDDLREKTHRGLAGQVARGMHGGGLSYGYRSIPVDGGNQLQINEEQAEWVRWIFARYGEGWSVQRIAHELNRLEVPSLRGGTWATSAIYGNPTRLSGVLNNELYIGRYIWNRGRWEKDPDTGKRIRIERPREEWSVTDMPQLRIVDDMAWHAARSRMARGRIGTGRTHGGKPSTLFGGILRCQHCGGPVIAVSKDLYGCSIKKDRGTCQGVYAMRNATDERLVRIVRDDLLSPEALDEMQRQARTMANKQRQGDARKADAERKRLADLDREIASLMDVLAKMGYSEAIAGRLRAMEEEKTQMLAPKPEAQHQPDYQAVIANYRRMLESLDAALMDDVSAAREILREILGNPVVGQDEGGSFLALESKTVADPFGIKRRS
ncbi:recombinase family protein [Kerstersia gyiorum]|uniref:recombinase family protein n=1 Tax=Kerstersia gyiorum TaxID=206506 RepID=UPI00209D3E6E|nr:recombinase family protein [Kerstersia gyiorum]